MSKRSKYIKQAKLPQAAYDQNKTIADVQEEYAPRTTTAIPGVAKGVGTPTLDLKVLEDYCNVLDAAINKTPVRVLCDRNHWKSARFFVMWQEGKGVKVQLEVKKENANNLDIRADYYMFLGEWDRLVVGLKQKDFKPVHAVITALEEKIISYGKEALTQ